MTDRRECTCAKATRVVKDSERAAAIMPNGQAVSNVYDAYDLGYVQAEKDARCCPVCGVERHVHTVRDQWVCMETAAQDVQDAQAGLADRAPRHEAALREIEREGDDVNEVSLQAVAEVQVARRERDRETAKLNDVMRMVTFVTHERDEARRQMDEYGDHRWDCNLVNSYEPSNECNCGWKELEEADDE